MTIEAKRVVVKVETVGVSSPVGSTPPVVRITSVLTKCYDDGPLRVKEQSRVSVILFETSVVRSLSPDGRLDGEGMSWRPGTWDE